jgi:hypothetical protein
VGEHVGSVVRFETTFLGDFGERACDEGSEHLEKLDRLTAELRNVP